MLSVVFVLALATSALASSSYSGGLTYQGQYGGKCGNDGFYYNDGKSFTICSNGNAYRQPCAPGSRNSPAGNYKTGNAYSTTSFCDVNLVDDGYTVRHGGYGGGHARGGYRGGYNAGGYNAGGYRAGGYNAGGYNAGGYNAGGYNAAGYGAGFNGGYGFGSGYNGGYGRGAGYNGGYGYQNNGYGYGQPAKPYGIGAGKGFVGGYAQGYAKH